MSEFKVKFEDNIVTIQNNLKENDIESYQIDNLEYEKEYTSKFKIMEKEYENKIFLFKKVNIPENIEKKRYEDKDIEETEKRNQQVIVVFSQNKEIKIMYCTIQKAYKTFISINEAICIHNQ